MKSAMLLGLTLVASTVWAQVPALFKGADLKQGEELMAEHKCTACHQKQVGGDGHAMYKPQGRINSLGALRGMVEMCNTNLNLGLFPEDVTSISAVLNRDHYHFSR
jgi:cytochrome c